jgi:hypothetical protein
MGFSEVSGRFRRIGDPFGRHQHCVRGWTAGRQNIGEFMRRRVLQLRTTILRHLALRHLAIRLLAISGLAFLLASGPSFAQSGDNRPQDQSGKPGSANQNDVAKDNQRKVDEFSEAAQVLNGPAGNPECVWLGRRVVWLMYRDDLDTAFRHLDLYDRFGCPGGHVQAAFRCLTRFFPEIDDKAPKSLSDHVHVCWINPAAQPQATAAAAAPTTSGNAAAASPAPQPSASPQPAAK